MVEQIISNKKEVLIIGNGISRLKYQDFIQNWKGEIWGCNSIYLEHQAGAVPRLDRLIGDTQAILPASQYKRKYGHSYVIYNKFKINNKENVPGSIPVPVPKKYIKDSGTTLVALALIEDYDRILCLGFDLGGKDIYVKDLHQKNKTTWVNHWRQLSQDFGLAKVEFVGYDHKPFILSNEPADTYAQKYLKGEEHIPEEEEIQIDLNVLIICKPKMLLSKEQKEFVDKWKGEVWLYDTKNYKDYKDKSIIRMVAVNIEEIDKFKEDGQSYSIYYPDPSTPYKSFKEYRKKWDWKLLFLLQALYESYDKIYIIWNEENESFQKKFEGILKEYNSYDKVEII